jgi:poly(beta-D-mannuronate) lyase
MLRVGLSVTGLSVGRALVEHNLFLRARGETRLVSNRSSGNVYRHNTFADSPTAQFDLRHGNDVEVHANFFRRTEGLRLFGDRHRIHGNYLESNYAGISLGNGTVESAGPGAPAAAMDRPDDCLIVFNTFVDNRTHLQLARAAGERLGARNITVAHNVFQGGTTVARIDGPYAGGVWRGNFVGPRVSPGQLPPEGYSRGDLQLQLATDNLQRPSASSPLLDAGGLDFAFARVDLDGQPRGDKPDAGADESSGAPTSARPLRPEDVGPAARAPAPGGSAP